MRYGRWHFGGQGSRPRCREPAHFASSFLQRRNENAILQAPFVRDAACIGVRHRRFGQSPAAVVAPEVEMDESELARRIDEFLQASLERWQRPRLYIRVDEVPRTLAKRTKIWPRLRELIEGVELAGDGVTTLAAYRAGQSTGKQTDR
ncbi:MAG: hypothetical protein DMG07_07800 [Acidobacteria bacterium]|nr:MAG: hypothetical protein DMG07_07800 [Acidobacteriota bacterium]